MIYLTYGLLAASLVVIPEIYLWLRGHRPWKYSKRKIRLEPDEEFFSPDPDMGLKHKPGTFRVHLSDIYSFTITHDENSLRITQPVHDFSFNGNGSQKFKDEIWVFGCSFTHGWTLNDDETYPWFLQKELSEFKIVNFGVSGFSTIQSLIQLNKAIESRQKPKYVIVSYTHLHDKRNIFLRSWKKIIEPAYFVNSDRFQGYQNFPCGKIDRKGKLLYAKTSKPYKPFPVMHYSALMHYLETVYNRLQENHQKGQLVTRLVMEEFLEVCDKNGIKLIVAGLDDSKSTTNMLRYCKREGISIVGMPVNLNSFSIINGSHTGYPTATINKEYAKRIAAFIVTYEKKIQKKKYRRSRMLSV